MIYKNLIKNKKVWSQLNTMVENNKLPHALLFHGPEGCGKEAHAIELAALLIIIKLKLNLLKLNFNTKYQFDYPVEKKQLQKFRYA